MLRPLRCLTSSLVLLAPLGLLAGAQGCSDEAPVENLCTWLGDSSNCAARFADDVGFQCGRPYQEGAAPNGSFSNRDALDMCVLDAGGFIMFDPPLLPGTFQVAPFSFIIFDQRAEVCGAGNWTPPPVLTSYGGSINFGMAIAPVPGATTEDTIMGGVYTSNRPSERDTFDVTCPGGAETHHFNLWQLDKCPVEAEYLPQAIVESNGGVPPLPNDPGGEGQLGYVRVRVVYPPANPELGGDPVIVEYANCSVPAPPHPCADGELNFGETDTDCGGDNCLPCEPGMRCVDGSDCTTGVCGLDSGLRVCLE